MSDNETYSFEVAIGFMVVAANKHDALSAALNIEQSLNDSSVQASYGGNGTVIRHKAPTMRRFVQTKRAMPNEPVQRDGRDVSKRRQSKLDVLTFKWQVVLTYYGKSYEYAVTAPTREAAIDKARVKCYHETSHFAHLHSIRQED